MKTFEQPLSAEEEKRYLKVMHGDDSKASHEARQALIERNMRLVAHIAKKYIGCGEDMEDLISIGAIGLIKAVNTFNPDKGSRLATYAARCIDNELLMMFRARKKIAREISLYEPIGTDKEGNEINLMDVCEQEQTDIIEDMDMAAKLKCLYRLIEERLDERERCVIRLRYGVSERSFNGSELTQQDIGRMLGISRSYVSRIEKKALGKLRVGLEDV